MEWLESFAPNVVIYWREFIQSCMATGQMFLIGGGISLVIGFFFGVLLIITRSGGIRENRYLYTFVDQNDHGNRDRSQRRNHPAVLRLRAVLYQTGRISTVYRGSG